MSRLRFDAVSHRLRETLMTLMTQPVFEPFRLVGGTNLALRFGHRMSDDIDLFTDAPYDSLWFKDFENFLKKSFPYYHTNPLGSLVGMGRSYYIGDGKEDCIKLDLMYMMEPFVENIEIIEGIRMASLDDILAMKVDVITRGGRKKDFWDLHLLHEIYPMQEMLRLHKRMYEWTHDDKQAIESFLNFREANDDPDPRCKLEKDWDIIRLDFIDWVKNECNGIAGY